MELTDALTITLLGIGVVFCGLILTNLMIVSFSLIPKLQAAMKRNPDQKAVEAGQSAESKGTDKKRTGNKEQQTAPVEPDILAVITTVLEVELRLRSALSEGKFTFK